MDKQKISPFYRTASPIGAAAQKGKCEIKKGETDKNKTNMWNRKGETDKNKTIEWNRKREKQKRTELQNGLEKGKTDRSTKTKGGIGQRPKYR